MKFGKIQEFNFLKVWIPLDVFDYRDVEIGEETYDNGLDKFVEKYPYVKDDDENYLVLLIDVLTGHVINWPKDCAIDFYDVKVVDEGKYALMQNGDETGDILKYESYVPQIIGKGGWGDYLEFEIDNDGNIPDWRPLNEDDVKEFEDYVNE